MKKIIFTCLSAVILLLAVGCRKDEVITETEITPTPPVVVDFTDSKIYGRVKDREGNYLPEARVVWGNQEGLTDENGFFTLTASVPERNAVLHVEKEGFFKSIQTLNALPDETIQTVVSMTPKVLTGTVSAQSGGIIETPEGGNISFAGGFTDESGAVYTGEVNVYAYYLDPTISDLNAVMPGNLTAVNSEQEMQLLQSFGMMNVELEDQAGNPLQISSNAVLTTPVPAELVGVAPATIPLWHFDEDSGVWLEEGSAELQGNSYVGEVAHFTWWNCDIPSDFIYLEGQINAGQSVPIFQIKLTRISDGSYGTTWSTDKGAWSGNVPKDELLLLEIFNTCDAPIYSEEIGPFASDTELPDINLTDSEVDWYSFSGQLVNCDSEGIEGYVIVSSSAGNSQTVLSNPQGNFFANFADCGDTELTYYGFDPEAQLISNSETISFSSDTEVGVISACDQEVSLGVFFTYQDGSTDYWEFCEARYGEDQGRWFEFTTSHQQGSSSVLYELTFLDWNADPNDPLWASNYSQGIFGTPEVLYEWSFDNDNVFEVIHNDELPGGYIHFRATALHLLDSNSGNEFTCEVNFHAIIVE